MKVLYLGSGFVGACSAAVTADSGHETLIYDIDKNKIAKLSSGVREQIDSCIYEEGLADLLIRNKDRIAFTTDYIVVNNFLEGCDVIFMCLPTPEIGETGESDLHYYFDAANKLAQSLAKRNDGKQEKYVVIINKSTVPIDMVDRTEKIMNEFGVKNFGVVANPEFLVEGKAIAGSVRPDRVVVGAWKEKDFLIMRDLYSRFRNSASIAYIETNPKEAAAGKLLANFYLFNKLAVCFDVIGRTCEAFADINFESIRKVLISDPRIGSWGLYDSIYAGGSCFIKDARSLAHQLESMGKDAVLVSETYLANKRQLTVFLGRAENEAKFSFTGKKVAVLGLAFKQGTNDVRNSPSIDIVEFLLKNGVKEARLYDPAAQLYFQSIFPASENVKYYRSESEAMDGADAVVIATDWPQFRELGDLIVSKKISLVMDGRRILQHRYKDLQLAGIDIIVVGSPFIEGAKNK